MPARSNVVSRSLTRAARLHNRGHGHGARDKVRVGRGRRAKLPRLARAIDITVASTGAERERATGQRGQRAVPSTGLDTQVTSSFRVPRSRLHHNAKGMPNEAMECACCASRPFPTACLSRRHTAAGSSSAADRQVNRCARPMTATLLWIL